MVAPSIPWTVINATQTDQDSPVDQLLMDAIRGNLVHIEEWMGKNYVAAVDHYHNGTDSKTITTIADGTVSTTAKLANLIVTEGKLANSAVAQAKLKTTTNSGSVAIADGVSGSVALTGGTYSWWTGSSSDATSGIAFGHDNTAAGTIGLFNGDITETLTFYYDERYIQASPPYDMGDGEVPLFIMLCFNKSGEIIGITCAPDPIWAYHGPTNIVPHYFRNGKGYQSRLKLPPELITLPSDVVAKATYYRQISQLRKAAGINDYEEFEITQAVKNADMNIISHPWGNISADDTVLIIDPVAPIVEELRLMQEAGENIRDILQAGYFNIGNTELNRKRPNGVMSVSLDWKNNG